MKNKNINLCLTTVRIKCHIYSASLSRFTVLSCGPLCLEQISVPSFCVTFCQHPIKRVVNDQVFEPTKHTNIEHISNDKLRWFLKQILISKFQRAQKYIFFIVEYRVSWIGNLGTLVQNLFSQGIWELYRDRIFL